MKTYNWEGVNPDGYFLDKLEPIPSALPSGLTPSQLYVFMPPNLGGFFMVRSYYPSECHADYFDFEDRKSGSAGMPRPTPYAVFCLKKKSGATGGRARPAGDRWSRESPQEPSRC